MKFGIVLQMHGNEAIGEVPELVELPSSNQKCVANSYFVTSLFSLICPYELEQAGAGIKETVIIIFGFLDVHQWSWF